MAGKREELNAERLEAFLDHLQRTGLVRRSLLAAGLDPRQYEATRRRDPAFAAEVDLALDLYAESVQATVAERGKDGWMEPVFYQGVEVAQVRKYSDKLLEMEAKRVCPGYRDRVQVDANVRGGVLVVGRTMDEDEWRRKYGNDDRPEDGEG